MPSNNETKMNDVYYYALNHVQPFQYKLYNMCNVIPSKFYYIWYTQDVSQTLICGFTHLYRFTGGFVR